MAEELDVLNEYENVMDWFPAEVRLSAQTFPHFAAYLYPTLDNPLIAFITGLSEMYRCVFLYTVMSRLEWAAWQSVLGGLEMVRAVNSEYRDLITEDNVHGLICVLSSMPCHDWMKAAFYRWRIKLTLEPIPYSYVGLDFTSDEDRRQGHLPF